MDVAQGLVHTNVGFAFARVAKQKEHRRNVRRLEELPQKVFAGLIGPMRIIDPHDERPSLG
jgi:hypothetical protein